MNKQTIRAAGKKALIESIYKYNWLIAHPTEDIPSEYLGCSLCRFAEQVKRGLKVRKPGILIFCSACPMHHRWPTNGGGVTEECDDEISIWNDWQHSEREEKDAGLNIIRCKILVEAFHDRLQEFYR